MKGFSLGNLRFGGDAGSAKDGGAAGILAGGGLGRMRGTGMIPALHDGGKVLKDGVYSLEKGEEVLPKEDKLPPINAPKKRNSEYRRVYLKRSKKV